MAESTLTAAYNEIQAEVALFLGFGRGPIYGEPAWTQQQQNDIDSCVKSGLRQFYFPAAAENESVPHDWSFLRPVATLDLPQNATGNPSIIPLPQDYGGFEGPVSVSAGATVAQPWRIESRNEAQIRQMYSMTPTQIGPPRFVAEQPLKGTGANQGQQFQLIVFPAADQDYTLQLSYYVLPDYLSGAFPYVYGGSAHTETVLESCKAMAEQLLDDAMSVHTMKFKERMAASIGEDRKHKAASLGYVGDRSDRRGWDRGDQHYWAPAATYNGNSFN
jgi:hypothetical protein